jgi:hypothetical protein
MNSKCIKDLNVSSKTFKQLQEKTGKTLEHIDIVSNFLNRTPTAQQIKDRIDKWNCINLKSSVQQRKQSLD